MKISFPAASITKSRHALSTLTGLAYGFGEELGWRGFLQDALRLLPQVRRYLAIGVLWGAWHLTTFASGSLSEVVMRMAFMSALWILGSWGIGTAVDVTRSVAVATVLHLTFNFTRHLPGSLAWPAMGLSVLAWIALFRKWPSMVDRTSTDCKPTNQ